MKVCARILVALSLLAAAPALRAQIVMQKGQTIGFMGDSITAQGAAPSGYVELTMYALKTEGVDANSIHAGVPGHTSGNMRARVEPQILSQGANWMTLSCGVNDVMMQGKGHGVDLETYRKNVTAMVEACAARNVKVVLLTPTPLGEDLANENNKQLVGYVEFLKNYGKDKHLLVADVNAAFQDYLKTPPSPEEKLGARLLADGIHPNQTGQTLMAKTLLLALGLPAADMPRIEKAWLENPCGKSVKVGQNVFALISQNQFNALQSLGGRKHQSASAIVAELWKQALAEANPKEGPALDASKAAEVAQAKIGALVDRYLQAAGQAK